MSIQLIQDMKPNWNAG